MKLLRRLQIQRYLTLQNGALAVALIMAAGWMWGTVITLQKNFVLQQEVDRLGLQVQIGELENQSLEYEQAYYRSNEYLELSARQHLRKALPGEKMVILSAAPAAPKSTTPSLRSTPSVPASNFQQWMDFFFGAR